MDGPERCGASAARMIVVALALLTAWTSAELLAEHEEDVANSTRQNEAIGRRQTEITSRTALVNVTPTAVSAEGSPPCRQLPKASTDAASARGWRTNSLQDVFNANRPLERSQPRGKSSEGLVDVNIAASQRGAGDTVGASPGVAGGNVAALQRGVAGASTAKAGAAHRSKVVKAKVPSVLTPMLTLERYLRAVVPSGLAIGSRVNGSGDSNGSSPVPAVAVGAGDEAAKGAEPPRAIEVPQSFFLDDRELEQADSSNGSDSGQSPDGEGDMRFGGLSPQDEDTARAYTSMTILLIMVALVFVMLEDDCYYDEDLSEQLEDQRAREQHNRGFSSGVVMA